MPSAASPTILPTRAIATIGSMVFAPGWKPPTRAARATQPWTRAFAAVVSCHEIPRALPDALVEGLAWDVAGRSYDTLAELEAYAARVAGAVGVMMALVMGTRDAGALARAADLGVAMQLTNIARDVGEDASMGRIYLPRQWLREAGIEPESCSEPRDLLRRLRALLSVSLASRMGSMRARPRVSHICPLAAGLGFTPQP